MLSTQIKELFDKLRRVTLFNGSDEQIMQHIQDNPRMMEIAKQIQLTDDEKAFFKSRLQHINWKQTEKGEQDKEDVNNVKLFLETLIEDY